MRNGAESSRYDGSVKLYVVSYFIYITEIKYVHLRSRGTCGNTQYSEELKTELISLGSS